MEFKEVVSGCSGKMWVCGKYTIHIFYYIYNGQSCDKEKRKGFWVYYDGIRLSGTNRYNGFDTLEDAIRGCEVYGNMYKM